MTATPERKYGRVLSPREGPPPHHYRPAHVGVPLRPALIWTVAAAGDALSSNGVPAWYDEDGQHHTTPPRLDLEHRTTGQHGSPARPGFDTAYLLLDYARDELPRHRRAPRRPAHAT